MYHGGPQQPDFDLDRQVLDDVMDCGDATMRTRLARHVAGLLNAPDTDPDTCRQIMPVARRLAVDPDLAVRRAFAAALSDLATLDADLLFTIASDDDEVALPFLTRTPALDPLRMLAMLRSGGEARQAVIAARADITALAIEIITRELSLAVNAMLLENAEAPLGTGHYHTLYRRFGAEKEMLDRLLARPDLPPVIRLVQARCAAAGLHALLADRNWLPADHAAELVIAAEEDATLEVLAAAQPFDLPLAIAFLIDKDMLTPSLIVHAACRGAMHVVAECLAGLSGLPRRRVEDAMYEPGQFASLFARCGLPQTCYEALQAACDVTGEECASGVALSATAFGARVAELLSGGPVAQLGAGMRRVA